MNLVKNQFDKLKKASKKHVVDQFVNDSQNEELRQRITRRVRNALEFSVDGINDKKQIIRIFARDFQRLQRAKSQWSRFIDELALTHVRTRGMEKLSGKLRKSLTHGLRDLFQNARSLDFSDENRLAASLFKQTTEQVIAILDTSLQRMTFDLVAQVFENLELLKKEKILGSMAWETVDTCVFDNWNHTFEVNDLTDVSIQQNSQYRDSRPSDKTKASGVFETTTQKNKKGKFVHTADRAEQHLMGATSEQLAPESQVIPRRFNALIKSIPGFLRDEVLLVTGEQFVSNKQSYVVEESITDTAVTKEIYVHNDPAIVLGDTVLVAWDSDDCHHEEYERVADGKRQSAIQQFIIASIGLLLTATTYLSIGKFSVFTILVFGVPLIASIWFAARSHIDLAMFNRKSISQMSVLYVSSGWFAVNLAASIGIEGVIYGTFLSIFVAVVAALGGVALIKSALN